MAHTIFTLTLTYELDVVAARQRARQIASFLGFANQDQTRIATAVSELARNAFSYAGGGSVEFALEGNATPQVLIITVADSGPGIPHLDDILAGRYRSTTGMGKGILGARRMLDQCDIHTVVGTGTTIKLKKLLGRTTGPFTALQLGMASRGLTTLPDNFSLYEVQQQNHELLVALAELKARQDELLQLTRELEDTNRGVVALYAELDEKADHLRRADEMKSRFLANMSHEFRTPLSSMRALSQLLLDRTDGELSDEQEIQVKYIKDGAESLAELVNDLLDLAKIEAGKTEIKPTTFEVADMFGALRGMLKPLLLNRTVELVFDIPESLPPMHTDEGKVSQIIRNFVSNALKFTEAGTIRVVATPDKQTINFSVSDTGVGIDVAHQDLIFEEFSQVENNLQRGVKGTGLGLPLCRKLAALLGGSIELQSEVGKGSVFTAKIPIEYAGSESQARQDFLRELEKIERIPVLVIEDHEETRFLYEKFLNNSPFQAISARSLREADDIWRSVQPQAVLLDVLLHGRDAWQWLADLKSDKERSHIPVIIASEVEEKSKGMALGADAYHVKPLFKAELLSTLHRLIPEASAVK
jgi:signal transduction histidine kinase/CheY-like chemotaxis protein